VREKHKPIPEAACKVNASTTYVCMAWKMIIPAPTQVMPYVKKQVRFKPYIGSQYP
jgi:hypothetical protein